MYSCLARAQEKECNCTEGKFRTVSGICSEISDGNAMFVFRFTMDPKSRDGNRDVALVRALASHQCGLGSIPAPCHMWVEFVVGSRLAHRVFLRFWFSSLHKNPGQNSTKVISKLQFHQDRGPAWKPSRAYLTSSLNIVNL